MICPAKRTISTFANTDGSFENQGLKVSRNTRDRYSVFGRFSRERRFVETRFDGAIETFRMTAVIARDFENALLSRELVSALRPVTIQQPFGL
jgi:hypothetical protein